MQPTLAQKNATCASYQISELIAKSGRAYSCGDFVKQCLTVAADTVGPNLAQAFSQIEDMAQDIREQVRVEATGFSAFSIACDKTTDILDSAKLLLFLCGVSKDFEVSQELAGIETLSVFQSSGKEQFEVGKSGWLYN